MTMNIIQTYLYALDSFQELAICQRRIAQRRKDRAERMRRELSRPRLSDEKQLAQDMERIGGDFRCAISGVMNVK